MNFLDLLYEMHQDARINTAQGAAFRADAKGDEAYHKVHQLELKVDKLIMISEALWLLLKQNSQLSDEDLEAMVKKIDLRDGRLDGRVASCGPQYCKKCGKALQKNSPICIYCGQGKEGAVFPT